MVVGAVVLLVVVIGVIAEHSGRSTPGPPASSTSSQPSTQEQAAAIDQLLDTSGQSRSALVAAVQELGQCSDINAAISAIQSAASQRSSQIQTAQSLDVSALPNGDGLQSDLIAALQHSLDADQDYQSWAADVQTEGCSESASTDDRYYAAAAVADDAATTEKKAFLNLWYPIASQEGLAQRPEDTI